MTNQKILNKIFFFAIVLIVSITFAGCKQEVFTPKPKGHFRIDMPEKKYTSYTSEICPFTFQIPEYAVVQQKKSYFDEKPTHPCWLNLQVPYFNGIIHLTYVDIETPEDLENSINDAYKYSLKHTSKADFIDEVLIQNNRSSGKVFDIGGNVASSVQFYYTDSTSHFLRGSLYFHESPNVDSLRPVINFLREDIVTMMKTTEWK